MLTSDGNVSNTYTSGSGAYKLAVADQPLVLYGSGQVGKCGELWHRTRADGFASVRSTHLEVGRAPVLMSVCCSLNLICLAVLVARPGGL